jgi:4-amino-4-deoxy-L-arabinose transferase-like glycosyltransferase
MFHALDHRLGHYLVLLVCGSLLFFPNLGAPSLWDIDEGNNATAAREMFQGDWTNPTFNYEIRTDKPALFYWLQMLGYAVFGINEFSARLPSAVCAVLVIFLTYELGRLAFHARTGFLAGIVLGSSLLFCGGAHFANPDLLLNACLTATMLLFWRDQVRNGRAWLWTVGITMGLAVLAKGPIGLILPWTIFLLYLTWLRRLGQLFDIRLPIGVAVFCLVGLPWYVWVTIETKGGFTRGFFLTHNLNRFAAPMENHSGPVFYYLGVLAVGLFPWSVLAVPIAWDFWKRHRERAIPPIGDGEARNGTTASAEPYRFLACWIAVYLVFFTIARTKLPNYVLPTYPAFALLIADFLVRWLEGKTTVPFWTLAVSLALLGVVGLAMAVAFPVAGGWIPLDVLRGRSFPGLEVGALFGVGLCAVALLAWPYLRTNRRQPFIVLVCVASVTFTATLFAWAPVALEPFKAPLPLASALDPDHPRRDIRLAAFDYFQPSLVFYCQRRVDRLKQADDAIQFLCFPIEAYLFVPETTWRELAPRVPVACREVYRHYDLYRHRTIVMVTNR